MSCANQPNASFMYLVPQTLIRGPKPKVSVWGSGIAFPVLLPPVANSNVLQVEVGRTKRAGVTDDGKVVVWEVRCRNTHTHTHTHTHTNTHLP